MAWIVSFIIAYNPPTSSKGLPAAEEAPEDAVARYTSIASDLVYVVWDKSNPPVSHEPDARERTAAIMLGIMAKESQFRRDIDLNIGSKARGDNGASYCMMQINVGKGRTQAWNATKNRFAYRSDP